MSKRIVQIIIFLSTVSLIAAIVTQLLWVSNAWSVKEDQFNNRVSIAMETAVNQLQMSGLQSPPKTYPSYLRFPDTADRDIFRFIDPYALDSVLRMELNVIADQEEYGYAVIDAFERVLVFGDYEGMKEEILASEHNVSLNCLCQNEQYLLSAYFVNQRNLIVNELIILPVMSGLFLMVLVFSFFFTIYFTVKQKKLTEIKADFVNNMTHEFKTPISTISVSSEMLMKPGVYDSQEKVLKYAGIIFDENNRLRNQVDKVLQIAILDRDDLKMKLKKTDAHNVILESVRNFNVIVEERGGRIREDLQAGNSVITADELHLANIINNLIDNANKYSPEKPLIDVATRNEGGKLVIAVSDHGIGISQAHIGEIFKKFQRISEGNIHNVKGFGIGLYYVKTATEAMGGKISVKSAENTGSAFELSFPV